MALYLGTTFNLITLGQYHKVGSIKTLPVSVTYCKTVYLSNCERRIDQMQLCKWRQAFLVSSLKIKINISCYSKYQAFGQTLIYNNSMFLIILIKFIYYILGHVCTFGLQCCCRRILDTPFPYGCDVIIRWPLINSIAVDHILKL